jgi:integrase/recombinase XerD
VSLTRQISNLVRQARLDYYQFHHVCEAVRKELGLHRPARGRHLPKILPESSLRKFYETISRGGNLQHEVMLKLLLFTGVRVSELARIRVDDVDLDAGKIFIESGKGDKDRYILFPDHFRLALKAYMAGVPENRYLFESQLHTLYSTRRIQELVADYAAEAQLPERVHPHTFRHQLLTWLTSQGMPDAQIQLISGHANRKTLEVYQHLSLRDAREGYQEAMKKLEV